MPKSFYLRTVAASAIAAFLISAPAAEAADLLPPPPPEIRTSIWDWSGAYVGGAFAGVYVDGLYTPSVGPDPDLRGDGMMGGLYAGYNYAIGNIVMGLEGDAMFGEVDPRNQLDQVNQEIDFWASVRARAGYAHDRTMAYVTGGVAFMDSEITLPAFSESQSHSHVGYVVGGGLEHAWSDYFVGRIEYLFSSFDTKDYVFTPGTVNYEPNEVHMVRFGGAWKF